MLASSAAAELALTGFWWEFLCHQFDRVPWGYWHEFWLGALTFGRNAVWYFLPLLLLLLPLPRRHLRLGILLTGVAFIGYVFGLAYLLIWLATCLLFHRLAERFAADSQRADVRPWGPPLAAIALIAGQFLLFQGLAGLRLPAAWNASLLAHARWLFPLGAREVSWEVGWFAGWPLFRAILGRAHDTGLAYFTMRMVSYFSEIRRGTIPREQRTVLNFLAYLCYAPTLLQGPLERFREFQQEIDTCHQRRAWRDRLAGVGRMGLGGGKCLISAVYFWPALVRSGITSYTNPVLYTHPEQIGSYALLFFGVHLQVLFLYLVFSGYCDIAIGMSRLLGYRAIENFRRPWLARSLTDMWRRWHISLSFILRDCIFFPLTRRRWNHEINLLITFLVCGLWHDLSGQYAAWGLVMGLMVAVNQRWARWMRTLDRHPQRRLAALRRAWLKLQPLPMLCAWLLTINIFVMSGWICFGGRGAFRVAWELLRRPAEWLLRDWGVSLPPLP